MIDFNELDVETALKLLSGLTAVLAFIQRIWDSLSIVKKRQAIKIDLDILELSKKHELINSNLLVDSLNSRISKLYIDTTTRVDNFRNFLTGAVLFVGFSWWSIDLTSSFLSFNPWIILTGFMSAVGFVLMFEREEKKKIENKIVSPFFILEIARKNDFISGFSLFVVFGLITWLIIKTNGFSFWIILTVLLAIVGVGILIAEMKIKTKK